MNITHKRVKLPLKKQLAIWSIFLVTSIAGMAITPILPELKKHFADINRTDIELLTSLPNMIIIPFVLLSGFIVNISNRIQMIRVGLVIFIASALFYQFASSYIHLLIISICLGAGIGLVIPLANALPAEVYYGLERQRQMGICAAIADASQVFCLYMTGVLYSAFSWKAPFLVYFIAVIPLVFSFLIKRYKPLVNMNGPEYGAYKFNFKIDKCGYSIKMLISLIVQYFLLCYIQFIIPLLLPFLLIKNGYDERFAALSIALFFFVQSIVDFFLVQMVRLMKKNVVWISFLLNTAALFIIPYFIEHRIAIIIAVILGGITGGIIEPMIWDKTSHICIQGKKVKVFSYIMSVSFFTIWVTPFIVKGISLLFNDVTLKFSFYVSGIIGIIVVLVAAFFYKDFVWGEPDREEL